MIKKVVLVTMPFIKPTSPPLGIASLKSYIETNCDVKVKCIDINLLFHLDFLEYLKNKEEKLNKREKLMVNFYDFIKNKNNLNNLEKLDYNIKEFLEGFEDVKDNAELISKEFNNGRRDDLSLIDKYAKIILDELSDIVGFSICYEENLRISLAMAKRIKTLNPKIKIVLGGSYVSSIQNKLSKIVGKTVDYIVYNQGEIPLLDLVKGIDIKNIPNLIYMENQKIIKNKEEIINDLNVLPFADFSDFNLNDYFSPYPVLPVLFSKGCYWKKCSFCVHHHSYSNTYRMKEVERFIEELEYYNENYGVKHFYFVDEMISSVYFKKIADTIIKRRLKIYYYALVKPTKDFTLEILKKIYDSGCRCLLLGIESGNQRILDLMNKGTQMADMKQFLKHSSQAGIKNCCFIIIGFPSETLDELEDTKKFLEKNKNFIDMILYGKFNLEKNSPIFLNPNKFGIHIKEPEGIGQSYNYKDIGGINIGQNVYDETKRFLSKLNGNKQSLTYLRDIMLIYYSNQNANTHHE